MRRGPAQACANVATCSWRALGRQKEIATGCRSARAGRLIRQLLTESILLALLGGAVGYAIAQLGCEQIGRSRIPLAMPVDLSVPLDYRVLLFSMALSMLTGVIFGLVPALRATQPNPSGAERRAGTDRASRRLGMRNLLVVAQVTICMVLLICSRMFLRIYDSAGKIDPGFTNRNQLMMALDPSLNRYSPGETRRIVNSILESTRALPGVESATLTSSVPLNLEGTQNGFVPEGQAAGGPPITADIYSVAPGFFETFGIRMIGGEDFRPGVPNEDIAIVNQALADRVFRSRTRWGGASRTSAGPSGSPA